MNLLWKRVFDFCLALVAMILLVPLFAAVALAVKLSSPGPILFRQRRLTMGMREFVILKFRTMRTDFDKDARGIQVKGSSLAITPVGRVLRKTKLDELPQLFNILVGDMSFVGPRPELPRRLQYYSASDKEIFAVRSGVSSPASVILANEEYLMEHVADPEQFYIDTIMPYKIELNKDYLFRLSLLLDLSVIIATGLRILGIKYDVWLVSTPELVRKRDELLREPRGVGL
jgi:lipopolysaccharide/colanic/teichoic acid biosynthesis glycosyltransferase